jgi:glucose-6-phosphate isomerase
MPTNALLQQLAGQRLASRIFERDTSAFSNADDPQLHERVRNRLGWLDAPIDMTAELSEIEAFASAVRDEGLTDVYLLGMGGSSLCAETLRDVPLARPDGVRLVVLDTTDERVIRTTSSELAPKRSLFIVASKSGSTLEVKSLERYFWSVMTKATPGHAGRHFVAITDPGTALEAQATSEGYRRAFVNPSGIGGRYSALSLFGLVPAALLGLDIRLLLETGRQVAELCRSNEVSNPGLALGAFMGGHALGKRDKLTLLVPPSLAPLGVWIEQLVAESTGKDGRGILPIVGEPIGNPGDYGRDRAFVAVLTRDAVDVRTAARRLEEAGHPVFHIETRSSEIGGEFFRWEFATAVAGAVIGVNPFDEPNVRDAKIRTQGQLDAWRAGAFRVEPPLQNGPGYARREHKPSADATSSTERYLALLDYLPPDARRADVVDRVRGAWRQRSHVATTYGVGPRYLHSTGQYHKGGPNSGLFLLVTGADASTTAIPGADYSFSVLKQAQALGDFEALVEAGREVIHYHIEDPSADFSAELEKIALGIR